jgi:multimeric flavodoxin WrbA
MGFFIINLWSIYISMNNNKLNEILDKYQVTEKNVSTGTFKSLKETIMELDKLDKVLLLPCSNRYNWDENNIDIPKSTILAMVIQEYLGDKAVLIDVPELNITPCEGNVSRKDGNSCGLLKAKLKDKDKNPTGYHRCWASLNDKDDELWKISKELFDSNAVIFFSSIRWGQTNMYYQKLIERLTWIENRHTTLGEPNIVENIQTGFICVGQNWKGLDVTDTQKKVHSFFGFKPNNKFYWNWQYTNKMNDESPESYKNAFPAFVNKFKIDEII